MPYRVDFEAFMCVGPGRWYRHYGQVHQQTAGECLENAVLILEPELPRPSTSPFEEHVVTLVATVTYTPGKNAKPYPKMASANGQAKPCAAGEPTKPFDEPFPGHFQEGG